MVRRLVILILVVFVAALAQAQDSQRKLVALDKLKLKCAEESLLNKTYKISKDGIILVDFLGAVEVSGLTETEAAEKISKRLVDDRILRKATVEVSRLTDEGTPEPIVEQPVPTGVVRYGGAVKSAGETVFRQGLTLNDVLRLAEPLSHADQKSIIVKSSDGTIKKVDSTLTETVLLSPGDELTVPAVVVEPPTEVYVFGGVAKPGLVRLSGEPSIKSAIEAAGGVTEYGIKKKIRIERDGLPIDSVDLTGTGGDFALKPNDKVIVDVTEKRAYVQVDGAVNKPGYFVVTPGMKLGDAIQAAGGYAHNARIEKVKVVSDGNPKGREVNFKEIEQGYAGDLVLKAGDQVIVPGPKKRDSTPLRLAAGFAAVWLIFGR